MNEFQKLLDLIEKLRGEGGCPWDKKQTIKSLAKCLSDEHEEVIQAIEKEDHPNLKEELGDLILNICMISQIAKEEALFDIKDVLNDVSEKVISRHTWVFGDDKAVTAEEALVLWKKNKKASR